jgi:hypothetical protein
VSEDGLARQSRTEGQGQGESLRAVFDELQQIEAVVVE